MPVISADDDQEEQIHIAYEPLTPSVIEDEKAQSYIEALNFACSRPDIRNIAVTGPYGAGKSSVLLTWEKAENNDFRVMTVSLADFDMQQASAEDPDGSYSKAEGDKADKKAAKAEEKTIEYSILQQLLYKEKKSVLPYSRLERISDVSAQQLAVMAASLLLILALTVTGLLFLFPEYICTKLSLPKELSQILLGLPVFARIGGSGIFLFSALFLALKKLHRTGVFDRRVSIDKVDVLKGAISTRPTAPSLLNIYIDEIVYFFEQTQYNVVIFEDLDRHNDGAIFIKLREINQLINNCLPSEKPVRFIYAVRDNLFSTPESRTKFFDFVMPVIPVMDSENASEHFFAKFTTEELEKDGFKDCLSRLSLFIPDMRIMHNIANEFRLYRNVVNNGEDLKRLVSLISYKNLCAEDYHGIDQKKGMLYRIIDEYTSGRLKEEYISKKKILENAYLKELHVLQNEKLDTGRDLRREMLRPFISDETNSGLIFIHRNNTQDTLDHVVDDEVAFLSLMESTTFYIRPRQYGVNIATVQKEKLDKLKKEYLDRRNLLVKKAAGGISKLNGRIEGLRHLINEASVRDLAFFINEMGSSQFAEWARQLSSNDQDNGKKTSEDASTTDFLYFLLRYSYLSTDYMSYRSVFMPGSLSIEDNNFIRAVTAGRSPDETLLMPLSNTANTLTKLCGLGIQLNDNAWHPQILLHILDTKDVLLTKIMKMQMAAGSENRLLLLATMVFPHWSFTEKRKYLKQLLAETDGLPAIIDKMSHLGHTGAEHILLQVLLSLPALSWPAVSVERRDALQQLISVHFDLITGIPEHFASLFCENLVESGCYLSSIPFTDKSSGREFIRLIAEKQCWEYSTHNLNNIYLTLSLNEENSISLFKTPMSAVRALQIKNVETVIFENADSFLKEIFIHSEDFSVIPEFLNSEMLSWENIELISSAMNFALEDLSQIKNRSNDRDNEIKNNYQRNIHSLLIYYEKICPSWHHFISALDEFSDVSEDILCAWLNKFSASLPEEPISLTNALFSQLVMKVISSGNISTEALVTMTKTFKCILIDVPKNIPLKNAEILINRKWLASTPAVFEQLNQALYEEKQQLTPLLYALICARPVWLDDNLELVLYEEDEFDRALAGMLLNEGNLLDEQCVTILNWLWQKELSLFSDDALITLSVLSNISVQLINDRLRHALLMQCLKAGNADPTAIRAVLKTFENQDYAAFLAARTYRSINYSDAMWALASRLESSEFLRAARITHDGSRIRIQPFSSDTGEHY